MGPTYWVATDGDDTGPGSRDDPWATLQHAADSVPPGATVYARLGGDHGSLWAVLLAALICMPVGALLALPAMRLHGLYLALATMAFASMVDFIFYSQPFAVGTRSLPVEHLRLFGLRFEGLRGFLLLVTALALVLVAKQAYPPIGQ